MRRILIVEDDVAIAELERDYLELSGFSVDLAADGATGLARALSGNYDLVIVDIMLPGTDGFEICRRLRASSDAPVMAVSARAGDIDKIRAFGLGADDYVVKPFSPSELVARVKAHLARFERLKGATGRMSIVVDDLELDLGRKQARRSGKEIPLTATEWCVLEFLASERGRIRSKEEIFDRIHGVEAYGDMNAVAVHVRRLREKIERDPGNPRIVETVWGMGYRMPG